MHVVESHIQGLFSETGLKENDLNSEFLSNIPSLVSHEDKWRTYGAIYGRGDN